MARIWLVHGTKQRSPAIAERPWQQCVELLEMDLFSLVEARPKFSEGSSPFWPTDVVVELGEDEAKAQGRPPGYYHLPLTPDEAKKRRGL